MSPLPPYVTRQLINERLRTIFPEGTPNRNYCVRELAASTVFAALYIGAVEGSGQFLGPVHVYRMTDRQAAKAEDSLRRKYVKEAIKGKVAGKRWYADNTREPIRDETLRDGLMQVGAVLVRDDLPTTSGLPRYALTADFAELFDPALNGSALEKTITDFQKKHLSKSALARVTIIRAGAAASNSGVRVTFPNGETRQLASGPSSVITQAVVEVFSRKFLEKPAVLWLSESGNKVVLRDDKIANALNLNIEVDKNLPDLILADLGPSDPLLVFTEIVATDGAMTSRRQEAIYKLTDGAGFDRKNVVFLTAYRDREAPGFRKTVHQLAWDSFAWFSSEPDQIVILRSGGTSGSRLSDLI
jgi:hypothetical protein